MVLKALGSSSAGNCYVMESETELLIIELGVNFSKVKEALGFNISKVVGAIVSHSHGDHSKYMNDAMNAGVNVWSNAETLEAKGLSKHHRSNVLSHGQKVKIGEFSVKAFPVEHDVPCNMFLIDHAECGLTLFLTDTMYCKYKVPGLNNIIIECNHDYESMELSNTPKFLRDRVVQSHMNLETCKEMLIANDLSSVNNIVLIHLSNTNSDSHRILEEIKDATGKSVHIAEPGLNISFNKSPF